MEVVSLIPARSGSKGVPDKNIREIGGKTLLAWSIKASVLCGSISRTIVSTDSPEYQQLSISLGAECPFLRPSEISTDNSGDIDFVKHALAELARTDYVPDFIVHLRPTTPFRDPNVIEQAISTAIERGSWTAIRSVHEMSESAYKSFELDDFEDLVTVFSKEKNLEKSNLGRQRFPKTYQANGYVDILSVKHILQTGEMHGNVVRSFITDPVIEIDSLYDLEIAQALYVQNPRIEERLFG